MPALVATTVLVRVSFLAAMAGFQAEGRGSADDDSMIGDEIRAHRGSWWTPAGFERYVRRLREQARRKGYRT
jgi:hypothetical protein